MAHQTEMMARQKRLLPLSTYLRRAAQAPNESRNADVIAMLKGMAKQRGGVTIKRIKRARE